MLEYIFDIKSLPFMEICQVYQQSLAMETTEDYWSESNDLYQQLKDFFLKKNGYMAVWRTEDGVQSALRLEPYRSGYLLCSLETRPDVRRRGFASMLVNAVLADLTKGSVVYSHVKKDNLASMQLHFKCGFVMHADAGRLLDGSVSDAFATLKYIK